MFSYSQSTKLEQSDILESSNVYIWSRILFRSPPTVSLGTNDGWNGDQFT